MRDERRLAMDRVTRAHDVSAEGGADALVAQADAENRCRRTKAPHDISRNAGLGRCAGAR